MHVDHASVVKKRDHQKFVDGFALSGLLGSGRASMLLLGTLSLGLSKSSFHRMSFFSKFKTEFYCILFFLTSRLHFWNSPAVTIRL